MRVLAYITMIFTLLSNGMLGGIVHVCTSPPPVKAASCCQKKLVEPSCAACCKEDGLKSEPSWCCNNVPLYYFTPKYMDRKAEKLQLPAPISIETPTLSLIDNLNSTIEKLQLRKVKDPPDCTRIQRSELNIWII